MIFSILGGGFGLYGYLPALIRSGHAVMLPERYRATLDQRHELTNFAKAVQWRATEDVIRHEADAFVISRRPSDQMEWLHRYGGAGRADALILEKPLGVSPAASFAALELLDRMQAKVRIAYTFRFMPWAKGLATAAAAPAAQGHIDIAWTFRAHHYSQSQQNWKRHVSEGGGALRFFGIHIVALLAELGYRNVGESHFTATLPDECERWSAVFSGPGLRECRVVVDSNSSERVFSICAEGERAPIVRQTGPFDGAPRSDGLDNRVEVLESLCRSLTEETALRHPWYKPAIALWEQAELAAGS